MTLFRGDWFYVLLVFVDAFFMTRPYLYAIQNDNYRVSEIFKNKRLRFVYALDLIAVAIFSALWGLCYLLQAKAFWGFLVVLFFFITEFTLYFLEELPDRKKPLRYTKRAVRCLLFVSLCCTATVTCMLCRVTYRISDEFIRYSVFFAFPIFYPTMFCLFVSIINVFEKLNNMRYERRTRNKLNRDDLIKIAITGSYGKTSVKNYLDAILSQKYKVIATPENYNTPMGISKSVNMLEDTHEIFIAEMGARRVGDIKKLMSIVRPQYAVLTGINEQHLATFGSKENIIKEKCKVLDVGEGVCVINGELKNITENVLTQMKIIPETIYTGLGEDCDIYAKNVSVDKNGSAFDIVVGDEVYEARTRVLGVHNVQNILLAVAIGLKLKVEMPLILQAIESLNAVPHRLELIQGSGVTIIDDSYNSNPSGARRALDTLKMFDTRRVVVTPGLVELGDAEREENYNLGEHIADCADVVLLVGNDRIMPIKRALDDREFCGEVKRYESLKSCEKDFVNSLRMGDTLLILNDLPDIYEDLKC